MHIRGIRNQILAGPIYSGEGGHCGTYRVVVVRTVEIFLFSSSTAQDKNGRALDYNGVCFL
jgi:hypothetical protein